MSTFIGQLVGFAVIILLVWRYVVPPVRKMMADQQSTVRRQLAESAAAADRLAEASRAHTKAKEDASAEAQRLTEEARADAKRIGAAAVSGDFDAAVAMADSALNKHLFELQDLRTISARIAEWADPASQSGTESRCRILLRRKGVRARTQVWIDGVGFVDLVVGQRLVIECDSATFHDGYQSTRDYDRDMALVAQGYIVLRLKYSHVMFEWDRVEALILSIVRARRHLWRAGGAAGTVYSL